MSCHDRARASQRGWNRSRERCIRSNSAYQRESRQRSSQPKFTPRINPRGGRDHYARAFSSLLAGGGVLGGQVIGETDANGEAPKGDPVKVPDLHASIWHAFGVDPWTEYEANDRPITLTPKEGRIVKAIFA